MGLLAKLQRPSVVYTGTGGTNNYTVHPSTPLPAGWVNRWGYRLEPTPGLYRVECIGCSWSQRINSTGVFEPREATDVASFAAGDQISVAAEDGKTFTVMITPI